MKWSNDTQQILHVLIVEELTIQTSQTRKFFATNGSVAVSQAESVLLDVDT